MADTVVLDTDPQPPARPAWDDRDYEPDQGYVHEPCMCGDCQGGAARS